MIIPPGLEFYGIGILDSLTDVFSFFRAFQLGEQGKCKGDRTAHALAGNKPSFNVYRRSGIFRAEKMLFKTRETGRSLAFQQMKVSQNARQMAATFLVSSAA